MKSKCLFPVLLFAGLCLPAPTQKESKHESPLTTAVRRLKREKTTGTRI
jgi:hypothetical protein